MKPSIDAWERGMKILQKEAEQIVIRRKSEQHSDQQMTNKQTNKQPALPKV